MQGPYTRFAAMIATSTVLMYALTYLNTYRIDHVFWSETRFFMAVLMGSMMSVVMLGYMRHMYERRGVNAAIVAASVLVFFVALYLVRSQTTVGDVAYMRAMIPHHSIAILTSDRARIADIRVRALADRIIESQTKEIDEMKGLITALQSDAVEGERAAAAR